MVSDLIFAIHFDKHTTTRFTFVAKQQFQLQQWK